MNRSVCTMEGDEAWPNTATQDSQLLSGVFQRCPAFARLTGIVQEGWLVQVLLTVSQGTFLSVLYWPQVHVGINVIHFID